jgi:hypothetical protein
LTWLLFSLLVALMILCAVVAFAPSLLPEPASIRLAAAAGIPSASYGAWRVCLLHTARRVSDDVQDADRITAGARWLEAGLRWRRPRGPG